jgi:predicted tellurium resistance membrane protein TerC
MIDFSPLMTAEGLISLLTLSVLEIVLGIDNIIFISIWPTACPKTSSRRPGPPALPWPCWCALSC